MKNDDLISRSALIAEHCDGCDALVHGLCDHDVCGAAQLIMDAPAVDAVEVVRCRDCKRCYKHITKRHKQTMWLCMRHDLEVCVRPGDFCSYGERRSENG